MKKITRVIFVRHGESDGNLKGKICGWHEAILTDLGRKQARFTGEFLKDKGIDVFYSSDLTRARQTAEIIGESLNLPITFDQRLRERSCGVLDGMPIDEAVKHSGWYGFMFTPNGRVEGGETITELNYRSSEFLKEIVEKHKDKTTLIVSHGGVLWSLVPFVLGVSIELYNGYVGMDNCSINVFAHSDNFALEVLNQTSHLGYFLQDNPFWQFLFCSNA